MGKPTPTIKPEETKDAGPIAGEQQHDATKPASQPLALVQALLAHGKSPAEIAAVISAHPEARAEIMTYLQQNLGNAYVQQVIASAGPLLGSPDVMRADAAPPPPPAQGMVSMAVQADGQWVQVYVSPGSIDLNPNVFMFFHGQRANLGVEPGLKGDDDNVSGNDVAGSAMAEAKAKNTLAVLPQGVDGVKGGGGMKALEGKGNLPTFLDHILLEVAKNLALTGQIVPKHIALAGHSAGGYMGVHEALSTAGRYADTISDITLMDTNYSEIHFADASAWMYTGSPNKTLRIVQGADQTNNSYEVVPDPDDTEKKKKIRKRVDPYWKEYFSETTLKSHAGKQGMTISKLVSPTADDFAGKSKADRHRGGDKTSVIQHTQVLDKSGKVQCDVLIMMSQLEHHEIRDSVMDDAIDSIGKGADGSDDFGTNTIPQYGREKDRPHHGNAEGPFSDAELKEQEEARRKRKNQK